MTFPLAPQVAQQDLEAGAARDKTVVVSVPPDSRLEALLCTAADRKARADAAKADWAETQEGILAELTALYPAKDIKAYVIPGGPVWPAMTYGFQRQAYLPARPVREHLGPVYEAFKAWKTFWRLEFGRSA
jgi:hypothetical protein